MVFAILLEHLPYEEGIKTVGLGTSSLLLRWNTYPMKRVLRLNEFGQSSFQRMLEHLPYEEGIKTCACCSLFSYCGLEHLPYEEGIKTPLF